LVLLDLLFIMQVSSLKLLAINSLKKSTINYGTLCQDIRERIAVNIIADWWLRRINKISKSLYNISARQVSGRIHGNVRSMTPEGLIVDTPYLFGIKHGMQEYTDNNIGYTGGGIPIIYIPFRFGKRHGRSWTMISMLKWDVDDYYQGCRHGLSIRWNFNDGITTCKISLFLYDDIIETEMYKTKEYLHIVKKTENIKGNQWNDYSLPQK